MIGKTISHYKIIERLGQGGMGVVYKAEDVKLRRPVALKFLPSDLTRDREANQRFIYEAQTASALDHQNVCTIYEIEESDDGQMFIAMAHYEGETLTEKIDSHPAGLPLEKAIDIAIQIAEGLEKVHKHEIVHRDIKPANIMITQDNQVKIVDFGLAKLATSIKTPGVGRTIGTPAYISPEQARGDTIDHRSDIWSLGVVLYEMVSGQSPFKGDHEHEMVYSIMNDEPPLVSGLPEGVSAALQSVINKSLEKNPAQRYQLVNEVLSDLRSIQGEMRSYGSMKQPPKATKRRKKSVFLYLGIACLLVLLIATGLYLGLGTKQDNLLTSIAVLPLDNLSNDPEQEYFSDGMTDALITELAKISALRVISCASVMHYKGSNKTMPEIAKELNVDAVVEGSVLQVGERVQIKAQLIQTQPEQHLWAQTYDRHLRDVLALHTDLARTIANQINANLTPGEQVRLTNVDTVDPDAYHAYLLGRYHQNKQGTSEDIWRCLDYFQEAINKDSSYAVAYTGLADAYSFLGCFGYLSPKDAFSKAKTAALKALEMDDQLAEAHTSLGFILLHHEWDWVVAKAELERAIELRPGYSLAHHLYADYCGAQKRFNEALKHRKISIQFDPLSVHQYTNFGWSYHSSHQYDEAIAQYKRAIEMDPGTIASHYLLGQVYALKGMYQEAIEEHKKAINQSGNHPAVLAALGHTYAVSGKKLEAEEILDDLLARARTQYISAYVIAVIYNGLGNKNETFAWLEKAVEHRDGWLANWLNVDPRLDNLRKDPKFTGLLRKIGL
jgi:serine/threonine protein kinase/Tfp pilus assembly protein PilF